MSKRAATSVAETGGPRRRLGRSVLAILGGFLTVVILSIGTDVVMHTIGIYPRLGQRMPDGLFVWATLYRTLYGILGGYVTARMAPYRPMWHAMIGAVIGTILGAVGAAMTWNKDLGPHWYALVLVVTGVPCAWIGARMREAQIPRAEN